MKKLAVLVTLAVIVASFALSAQTWIDLARLSGFRHLFHGVPLAWAMPVAVDGYVVMALLLWMGVRDVKLSRFAKVNTYVAASLGVAAQSLYHGLTVGQLSGPWFAEPMAFGVGALPPLAAALSIHMLALLVTGGHLSGQRTADSVRTADSGQPARERWASSVSGQRTANGGQPSSVSGQRTAAGHVEGIAVRTLSGQRTVYGHNYMAQAASLSGQRMPGPDSGQPARTADSGQRTADTKLARMMSAYGVEDTKPDTDTDTKPDTDTDTKPDTDTASPAQTPDTDTDIKPDSGQRVLDLVTGQPVTSIVRTGGQRADIINYLSGHPDTPAKTLADMFGVDVRTARRYRARMSGQAERTEQ